MPRRVALGAVLLLVGCGYGYGIRGQVMPTVDDEGSLGLQTLVVAGYGPAFSIGPTRLTVGGGYDSHDSSAVFPLGLESARVPKDGGLLYFGGARVDLLVDGDTRLTAHGGALLPVKTRIGARQEQMIGWKRSYELISVGLVGQAGTEPNGDRSFFGMGLAVDFLQGDLAL